MDQKTFTRGDNEGATAKEAQALEFDFGSPFKQYKVCEELGIDPTLFGRDNGLKLLRSYLEPQVRALNEKNVKPERLNEKQLIDKMIEAKIETQCYQPSFIMDHPLIMSPLAKSHS